MRAASLSLLVLALAALEPLAWGQGQPRKDLDALQGTWLVEGLEYDGMEMSDKFKLSFVIKEDIMTIEGDGAIRKDYGKIKLKIDQTTTPRCVDLKVTSGDQVDLTMEGIYEVKGDEFKLCVKVFGQDRPSKFASPEGGGIALLKLKRQKK